MAKRKKAREVKRILNCIPSVDTEEDWRFRHAIAAGVAAAPEKIPAAKDLRESWWHVGNQGSTGSCVGWACADSVLRWHFTKSGAIKPTELLSPRFTWMAAKETDEFRQRPSTFIEVEGTSLKAALDIARKFGAVRDEMLPFESMGLFQGEPEAFYAAAAQLKIASYFNLGFDLVAWRTWIATKGPILTRLDVDATWYEATDHGGNLDVYRRETARGGHAVALVGYTADRFIVRNSWDVSWGDKGFAYASVAYAQMAFTEAYGVNL